jgi:hypothetical protein
MANLFWKNALGELITLTPEKFKTEELLETYLYNNPILLGDLIIISRQIKTGNHRDIPDLIAVDADSNVVIVELKKGEASEDVIPQVLRYAIWAEANPDSIKNLWWECTRKPEDWKIDWDNLTIKIMIICETIPSSVLKLVNRIRYDVELIEISRFISGKDEFVLLNPRIPEAISNIKTSKGLQIWDDTWYRENYHSTSVDAFLHTVHRVEAIMKKRDWNLEIKYNKSYVAFKYGVPNVFGVVWIGTKSFCLYFKIKRPEAEKIIIEELEPLRYEDAWNQILYKVDTIDYPIEKLMPLFEAAYRNITGDLK